jgi:hypothetical protein
VEVEQFSVVEVKEVVKLNEEVVGLIKELVVVINNKVMIIVINVVEEVVEDLDIATINLNATGMLQFKLNKTGTYWKKSNSPD